MLFRPQKNQKIAENAMSGALDIPDIDVFIVRGTDGQLLFANQSVKDRLQRFSSSVQNCKMGYSRLFPTMCDQCRQSCLGELMEPRVFNTVDEQGRTYSCTAKPVTWLDGKPATIMYLRDIDDEFTSQQKLYNLAYVDQLTAVPNRQRFREDFDALIARDDYSQLCGIVTIFDLDNFKAINDTYGHNTGDIMLRRLTDHLQNDAAFKGHLYRLGGDEFVLFYHGPASQFQSDDALRSHYHDLLSGALMPYTMPNIDLACTLSMGVAFFPQHGSTTAELLRKADIALYKVKAAGGDSITLFEDQYDIAKKLKDLYINIQPILKSSGATLGYMLVDRGNELAEPENAINLGDFNRTMDALNMDDLESNATYFIAYTNQLHSAAVRQNLPKEKFAIEVSLPKMPGDDDYALIRKLHSYGYALVLTDVTTRNVNKQLMDLAKYAKFAPGVSDIDHGKVIKQYPNVSFVALNVDTPQEFEMARRRGFKLFQGYYFQQPTITRKTKEIAPLKANYFRLLKLSSAEGYVDFKEISAIISADVALSYKLLKLLNSAAAGLRYAISSIDMAVAYLGEEKLKKWIALLALRGLASDQPLELVRMSLIRAQFGESLSGYYRPRRNPNHAFFTGMFSLLHIAMDMNKEDLLADLPIAQEVRDSLLSPDGPYSDMVAFFSHYEYANWEEVANYIAEHHLDPQVVTDSYILAVKWCNDLTNE